MELGFENYNFKSILDRAASNWGNKCGWIFDESDAKYTFAEIKNYVEKMEKVLKKLGVCKDDKIALMLPNVPEFPVSWLACGYIGSVMVPISYKAKKYDASYLLTHAETKIVITESQKVELLNEIRETENNPFKIMTIDKKSNQADYYLNDLMKSLSSENYSKSEIFSENLINIQYTSGTTGKPKGCMLTQHYWINIARKIKSKPFPGLENADVMLTAQPFNYMDPQWNTMASLISGATLIVLDRFSPSTFWKKIRKYKVSFFYCLGSMPALMLKMPESSEDKKHYVKRIGCSAIPLNLHEELENRWGVPWFEIFGMTETGYDISMTYEEQGKFVGTGALGRPVEDREARVVNEEFKNVPRGKTGELILRGKGMMEGYYKNPEATNEIFERGWFHTGDLAKMDKNGLLYIVGRQKDMIRRSGENIAAAEVESAIMSHPDVKVAACIPVEDDVRGEEVKAYIIPVDQEEDQNSFAIKLSRYCEEMLSKFKIPRYWELVEELPVTPSERIAKHILKEEKDDLTKGAYDLVEQITK